MEQLQYTGENGARRDHIVDLSLVIPTRNEAGNIPLLYSRLSSCLDHDNSEVVFVDDSDDTTAHMISSLDWPMRTRLVTRKPEDRHGGLSTAVLGGFQQSHAQYIAVMDADLQHPPELLPTMLMSAKKDDLDMIIGSRFVKGGSTDGLDGPVRKMASRGTIFATQLLFPKIRDIQDPMSGFFLFNSKILENSRLDPQGFKILLEMLINTNWVNIDEVPYRFERRMHGESKLNWKEVLSIYTHILKLRTHNASSS
ncbi:MAG: polyprenol monophosphomannose synthase [Candidatus Roizmanbacteria bacterium]